MRKTFRFFRHPGPAFRTEAWWAFPGAAYKPFGDDKTVIRAGFGRYGNLVYGSLGRGLGGGPFSGSTTYTNAVTNGVPLFSFPSPFLPTGAAATQNAFGVNPNLTTPYTEQWNFTVERQLGSAALRVSYVGSHSAKLIYARNLNQPPPGTIFDEPASLPDFQQHHLLRERRQPKI